MRYWNQDDVSALCRVALAVLSTADYKEIYEVLQAIEDSSLIPSSKYREKCMHLIKVLHEKVCDPD